MATPSAATSTASPVEVEVKFDFSDATCGLEWDCKFVKLPVPTYLLPPPVMAIVTEYVDEFERPVRMMELLWKLFGRDVVDDAFTASNGVLTLHDDHSESLYNELRVQYTTTDRGISWSGDDVPLVEWKQSTCLIRECLEDIERYVQSNGGSASNYLYNIWRTNAPFNPMVVDRNPREFKDHWKEISSMPHATPDWLLREDHLPLLSMEGLSAHPRCEEILRQGAQQGAADLIDRFCAAPHVVGHNLSEAFFDLNDKTRALLVRIQDTARISEPFFHEFFTRPSNKGLRPNCSILHNRHVGAPLIKKMFDTLSEEKKVQNAHRLLSNESLDDSFYTQYPDIFTTREIITTGRASGKFIYQNRDQVTLRYILATSSKFALWLKGRALLEELYRIPIETIKVPLSPKTRESRRIESARVKRLIAHHQHQQRRHGRPSRRYRNKHQ